MSIVSSEKAVCAFDSDIWLFCRAESRFVGRAEERKKTLTYCFADFIQKRRKKATRPKQRASWKTQAKNFNVKFYACEREVEGLSLCQSPRNKLFQVRLSIVAFLCCPLVWGVQSFIQFLTSVPIPLQPVLSQQYLITSQAIREGKS